VRRAAAAVVAIAAALATNLTAQDGPRPAPEDVCAAFDVAQGTIQRLWVPPLGKGEFRLPVELGGRPHVLALRPHEMRAPTFRLLLDTPAGVTALPTPPSVTWRGAALGTPDSIVAATVIDGALEATVRLRSPGTMWAIQPLGPVDAAGWGQYLVYEDTHNVATGHRCGVTQKVHPRQVPAPLARGGAVRIAEIAVDADSNYLSRLGGSTTAVHNDVTGVLNGVDAIYTSDVRISYQITTILVRTSATNPYTTNDASGLLNEFRSEWSNNQTAIVRDVAHLFTGRNISGSTIGIAYLGAICSSNFGYGVSQSRYSSNMTNRVALTAHELGHNWNADHCNSSNDCRIMCASLGGCSGVRTSFGAGSIAVIDNFANGRACLSSSAPLTLTSLQPNPVFTSGGQAVTISGTGMVNATSLDIGSSQLVWPGGFRIIDDNTIEFPAPRATNVGAVPVSVANTAGPSNALSLTYQAHSPPQLYVGSAALAGFPLRFEAFGSPGHYWFVFAALTPTTVPVQGVPVLQDRAELGFGSADAIGAGGFLVVPPVGVFLGATIYTQAVFVDPATLGVSGSSAVQGVLIFG